MNIFSKNKLKLRNKSTKEYTKIYMEYYDLKEHDNFKIKLLKEMLKLGNNTCLMIVDTTLSYNQTQEDKEVSVDKLTNLLDNLDIEYKKIVTKSNENSSLLGIILKANNKKIKNYIVGFVVSEKRLENLRSIMNCYNIHYYMDSLGLSNENLLKEVETYYYDEDELHHKFNYNIFDSPSTKNMAIHSKAENEQLINKTINIIKKDFE